MIARWISALFFALTLPSWLQAEVVSLEIHRAEPFAEGASFGEVGPYERLVGVARFAVDPNHLRNKDIVDLDLAPRNREGKVEFEADVYILAPKNRERGNGAILYDVNNRGNKLAIGFFNSGGAGNEPGATAKDVGNGFLFRRGYTIVWCGWIGELLPGQGRMLLRAPVARQGDQPIRGIVRYEMATDILAETLPLSRREGHGSYSPTEKGEKEGVLTWRMRETDPRVAIPRSQWSLERMPIAPVEKGVPGTLPQIRLRLAGGFRAGYLYDLVCEAQGPIVQGLGFAGVRDLISFLRYDASPRNPLRLADGKPAINRTHGFGVSQSGRFLRHFVYQNFNIDEQGRRVFDGLMPHVAGGGLGFFNHRFAQPTRHNGQHEEHLYPNDIFPFAYGDMTDPFSKQIDGILRRTRSENPHAMPKIMHTQSSAEYWHRSGSLVHTDPLGERDTEIPAEVRIYAFGGTQHGPAADPPGRGVADNLLNPGDYRPQLRALLDALDDWVKKDIAPPESRFPRIDRKELVHWSQEATGFPAIPGVRYPEVIQKPQYLDLGPEFRKLGRISIEPPQKKGDYVVKVCRSGTDGNDLGTLLPAEVAVPVATFTGWNLRRRESGAEAMLAGLMGSFLPFPQTRAARESLGDPRPSLEERYGSYDAYLKQFSSYCDEMVRQRVLLAEDAERLKQSRKGLEGLFPGKK